MLEVELYGGPADGRVIQLVARVQRVRVPVVSNLAISLDEAVAVVDGRGRLPWTIHELVYEWDEKMSRYAYKP